MSDFIIDQGGFLSYEYLKNQRFLAYFTLFFTNLR